MEGGSGSTTVYALRLGLVLAATAELGLLMTAVGGPFAPVIRVVAPGEPQLIAVGHLVGVVVVVASVALFVTGASITLATAGLLTGAAVLLYDSALDATMPPAVVLAVVVVRPAISVVLLGLALAAAAVGTSRRLSRASMAMLLVAFAIAIVRAATYDPFFDPACTSRCETVRPLIPVGPAAVLLLRRVLDIVAVSAAVSSAVAAGRATVWSFHDPPRLAILIGAGCLAVELAARNVEAAHALDSWAVIVPIATVVGFVGRTALAVGFGWSAVVAVRTRVRFDELAATVTAAESAHAVERLITAAAGVRATLTFSLPDGAGEIGGNGEPVPEPNDGELATPVTRLGAKIATIRHPKTVDGSHLVHQQSPAMLAAIEIERLRATRLATVRLVRESRSRIVASQDLERRRVERDLHDGAQQRILAAGVELTRAAVRAERSGLDDAAELRDAADMASAALHELRRLARGVHPAILSQGLDAALTSLAEDAQISITVEVGQLPPLNTAVELAAYRAVSEIVATATKSGATHLVVRVRNTFGRVEVDIEFDGGAAEMPLRVADRIGAAGGDVELRQVPGEGHLVHAVLPCA